MLELFNLQGQFWNPHWIPHKVMKPDFQFFVPKFFLLQVKLKKKSVFLEKNIFLLEDLWLWEQ